MSIVGYLMGGMIVIWLFKYNILLVFYFIYLYSVVKIILDVSMLVWLFISESKRVVLKDEIKVVKNFF